MSDVQNKSEGKTVPSDSARENSELNSEELDQVAGGGGDSKGSDIFIKTTSSGNIKSVSGADIKGESGSNPYIKGTSDSNDSKGSPNIKSQSGPNTGNPYIKGTF